MSPDIHTRVDAATYQLFSTLKGYHPAGRSPQNTNTQPTSCPHPKYLTWNVGCSLPAGLTRLHFISFDFNWGCLGLLCCHHIFPSWTTSPPLCTGQTSDTTVCSNTYQHSFHWLLLTNCTVCALVLYISPQLSFALCSFDSWFILLPYFMYVCCVATPSL